MEVPKSKVELHVHLDGSVRISTIIDLAKGDAEAIERMAYEFCEDIANNGVMYCEVRYCPHLLATSGVDGVGCGNHHGNLSPRNVVECVNKGLARGCEDFGVKVNSILTCMRHRPDWSAEIVQLCFEFQNRNVVGIDLAGDESRGEIPAIKDHIAAFQRAVKLGISRTVHAGEAGPAASVHEAIFLLHANRIGHGYHVLEDQELYDYVINNQIHLELCLTSSRLTGAVPGPFDEHPAIKFEKDGVNFSLSTDDMTICANTMRTEFSVAFNKMSFTAAMLTKATFNAARSSFLPPDEKEELIYKLKVAHGVLPYSPMRQKNNFI